MTEPTQKLRDDIFRRRVPQAQATPPDQRLTDCFDLYQRALDTRRDGIRHQFPDDADVERILRERLDRIRKIEEFGLYEPVGTRQG